MLWGAGSSWFKVQQDQGTWMLWDAGPSCFSVMPFWGAQLVQGTGTPPVQGTAGLGCTAGSGHRSHLVQGAASLGYRTLLVQAAVGLECRAGSGCRSLPSQGAAGAGCPAMSRHTAGSGHGSLLVQAQPDWDARLDRGTGPSGLGCSCTRAQTPPDSGPVRDVGPFQFGIGAECRSLPVRGAACSGCGSLLVQDRSGMQVLPGSGLERDAGPSRFRVRVLPGSGPERDAGLSRFRVQPVQDAGPSWFRIGDGCGSFPVRDQSRMRVRPGLDAAGSGCRSLPVRDRSGMRVPPDMGPVQDAGPSLPACQGPERAAGPSRCGTGAGRSRCRGTGCGGRAATGAFISRAGGASERWAEPAGRALPRPPLPCPGGLRWGPELQPPSSGSAPRRAALSSRQEPPGFPVPPSPPAPPRFHPSSSPLQPLCPQNLPVLCSLLGVTGGDGCQTPSKKSPGV